MTRRNRWLTAAIVVAISIAAAPALRRHFLPLPMDRCTVTRFDRALWRDSVRVYSDEAIRGCIVDDLLRRINLHGRTRGEIVALLGEPKKTAYFKEYDLVYWLGPERGAISIDSEWLVMKLDKNGRVMEPRLVTD
jgi:hypothetical protein